MDFETTGADDSSSGGADGMSGPVDSDDDDDGGSAADTDPSGVTLDSGMDSNTVGDDAGDTGSDSESDGGSSGASSDDAGDERAEASDDESSSSDSGTPTCMPFASDGDTVALWHFDDAAGQVVVDASGNGRDLQFGPTAGSETADPVWGGGVFDGGLSFTNADQDYATHSGGNTFPTNELSVEFWVRSTSDDYAQLFTAGFINCFVAMDNNGAGVQFGIGDGSNWEFLTAAVPAGTFNDGAWHYIAATYDGSTMRAYADGVEIGAVAAGTTLAAPGDYKVGGRPANTFLDGDMDEVRLSDVARTADEIAAAYEGCE